MPKITKPSDHFQVVTWQGNNTTQQINVGFKPDFVWIKCRTNNFSNVVFDSTRGVGKYLNTDRTRAEQTDAQSLISFDSNGFTIGSMGEVNSVGQGYVAWCWKANGAAIANTDGSLASNVSANKAAGFSVVTYTADGTSNKSIGHGLGVKPSLVIVKDYSVSGAAATNANWNTWYKDFDVNNIISLNSVAGSSQVPGFWWQLPNDLTFSVGPTGTAINNGNNHFVAYCFAEIDGYSKIGSYSANGNPDGPFINCGFRPKYILLKRQDSGSDHWQVVDTERDAYNAGGTIHNISPDSSATESNNSNALMDILANGFKIREGGSASNAGGAHYIFMAFAEHPFKYSNAR